MSTTAQLTYIIPPTDGSPIYTTIDDDHTTGKKLQNWTPNIRTVKIEDVRGNEHKYTLDTAGFRFHRHPAKHTRFLDDEEIKAEYYPNCMELLKELTGATKVFVFDHTVRRRHPGTIDSQQTRQPVTYVHVDRTPASCIARVHKHFPPNEASELLRRRVQVINLWRPISHPAVDWPLAFCDYRSVNTDKDLLASAIVHPDHDGQNFVLKYNPEHRWVYKSAMDPEDVVLIKIFDSISDGSIARLTPHTAFKDPKTPEGAPFRESIEVEALVFYKED